MKLGDRVRVARVAPTDAEAAADDQSHDVAATAALLDTERFATLRVKVQDTLLTRLGTQFGDSDVDDVELGRRAVAEVTAVLAVEAPSLSVDERRQLANAIGADLLGYGPLQPLLVDPDVSEIMVNGTDAIYVERAGKLGQAEIRFRDEASLRRVINRIVAPIGRRIDESSPTVDARLPDGSRVCAVIPPLSVDGSNLTIRKFSAKSFTAADLVARGTATSEALELIEACVRARLNVLVSGGTGSGKTTLLNVCSSFIPEGERILTIEDVVELQLRQHHVVRLEARPGNAEGKGAVPIRDLVRTALRMRPDRIVVGECRGGEALDMLQAMNTGHDGSMSTLHANTPADAMSRLETMVLTAGIDFPLAAIRNQIASAVDAIVHISRMRDGSRRVTAICEVGRLVDGEVEVTPVFGFRHERGLDSEGRVRGELAPTGHEPVFLSKIRDNGIDVDPDLFRTDRADRVPA